MMPQPISSREDIKRDHLQEWIETALDWIAQHRQTFFSVVGTGVVTLLVAAFIVSNFHNLRKQAWDRYSAGQTWAFANNTENAVNFFNEVINNYAQTPAAPYALLGKGDILYRQRKFQEAVACYRQALEKNPAKTIVPLAQASLGAALEESGDVASAINEYRQFVNDHPDHYLTPKLYESLGRAYELSLNPDAAKEIYEKIITMYPSSLWSEKARIRYQIIVPQPFQNMPQENETQPKK